MLRFKIILASTPTKYKAQENQHLSPIYFGEELFFLVHNFLYWQQIWCIQNIISCLFICCSMPPTVGSSTCVGSCACVHLNNPSWFAPEDRKVTFVCIIATVKLLHVHENSSLSLIEILFWIWVKTSWTNSFSPLVT